jgi:putative membrane protein insertion efficiency factor
MRKIALLLLKIYQKFFTLIGFGSCRYYPTCSEYARIHFEKNSLIKALFLSFIRILRCNQLFEGGFDYPVVTIKNIDAKLNSKLTSKDIKYWLIPKGRDSYYLVKKFKESRKYGK